MWVPPELKDPVLLHAPTRKSLPCFGAVSIATGKFIYRITDIFNAETFLDFLKILLRYRARGKKMVLILDNARYHRAVYLRDFLRRHRRYLQLLYLPPYSPQLNPIERVWKLARRLATHNRYFPTLRDLVMAVMKQFDLWRDPNGILTRLCCIT